MAHNRSDRREDLIARIRALPVDRLADMERFLSALECGDSSPLSQRCASASDHQRLAARVAATESGDKSPHSKDWPHAPIHRLSEHGTYIVTAGTLHKQHFFRGAQRLELLESTLLRTLKAFDWQIEAWAAFSNHYHFVAHARPDSADLREVVKQLHGETAHALGGLDGVSGRAVWHNFWDTKLTFEKSYLARLNYVHQNPVKHGLVPLASQYRWCSAAWFERAATRAQLRTIYSFKIDKLTIQDDYEPI
jgi:putative transposase